MTITKKKPMAFSLLMKKDVGLDIFKVEVFKLTNTKKSI